MKTLVIHPSDPTTEFLEGVYSGLDMTVLRSCKEKDMAYVDGLIESHDRVICLGHGTPTGLLSVGQFSYWNYVITSRAADLLRNQKDNIYIWCNADQFVQRHSLPSALYSGMFVSEMGEATIMGVDGATHEDVYGSNAIFAAYLKDGLVNDAVDQVADNYRASSKALNSPVMQYNANRLYSR